VEPLVEIVPKPAGLGILKMRPYQGDAVEAAYESWRRHAATLVVLPTGCGKTVVAADAIMRHPGEGRILFVAHLREILFQTQDAVEKHTGERPGLEMGMYREGTSGHGILDRAKVLCASIQTLQTRMDKLRPEEFDLVIIDEAHHSAAASYRRVWEYFQKGNPQIRGLLITATPNRKDGISLRGIASDCAFELSIREAIDDGWLVPIRQQFIKVEELDFSGLKTRKNKHGEQDFSDDDMGRVMGGAVASDGMSEEERLAAIARAELICHRIAEPTIRESQGRQGIVFCASVAQAVRQAEVMSRWPGVTAEAVIGDTPEEERREIVRRFRQGEIQFLTLCQIGTEGFDVPGVEIVAMARPTGSLSLYMQMLGRGTRPLPGLVDKYPTAEKRTEAIANSRKSHMLVLDFVGNASKYKLISTMDVLAGDMPDELIELVKRDMVKTGKSADVREAAWEKKQELDKADEERRERIAKREAQLREEQRKRAEIRAEVTYSVKTVDPFDAGAVAAERSQPKFRGGCSDKQVAMLRRLGMEADAAMALTARQASGAIGERLGRKGKDYIVRMSGKLMGKSLSEIARIDMPALAWLAQTTSDAELRANIATYREQWKRGIR
jgi:superfamily II DNA or RNA helicase